MSVSAIIQERRDSAADWTSNNPTLEDGRIGVETDTRRFKFGTGAAWNSTAYAGEFFDGVFTEAAAPGTPAAGTVILYAKTDGLLYSKDDAGTETQVSGGAGGGSGGTKTYAVFTALDNQPPATDFATFDTANSIALLSFSATATNRAIFVGKLPEAAVVTSGLKVYLHWRSGGATSGNAVWNIEFEKSTGLDLDANDFDTVTSTTAAASATDGAMVATEITCTTIDSIVAGDVYRLRVSRLGADGSDSLSVASQLMLVEVRSAA